MVESGAKLKALAAVVEYRHWPKREVAVYISFEHKWYASWYVGLPPIKTFENYEEAVNWLITNYELPVYNGFVQFSTWWQDV